MPNPDLLHGATWNRIDLPGPPEAGTVPLRWTEIGDGGPLVTITCGVHGDEGPWSAMAVRRALSRASGDLTGRIRVVLAANPTSVAADARTSPLDGLDLNRTFPGNAEGSHTGRLAVALAEIVEGSDLLIDLHGGGSWCVNAFTFRFPGSERFADAVGAPFVVDMPIRSGNLAGHVSEHGSKIVAIEMGGRSVDELLWKDRLADGIERILAEAGALAPRLAAPERPSTQVSDLSVVRPAHGGVLVPELRQDAIGSVVPEGTLLGTVHDLGTMEPVEELRAPHARTAMLLIRPHVCVLEGGAMTYVIGRAEG